MGSTISIQTKQNPIGVAEYSLHQNLPKELQEKLPTEKEFKQAFRN